MRSVAWNGLKVPEETSEDIHRMSEGPCTNISVNE